MTKEESKRALANTKVYVGEHRKKVIEKLIELGFNEPCADVNITGLRNPEFLYISDDGSFVGGKKLEVFFSQKSKQIGMSEILDIHIDYEFKDGDVLASSYGCPFIFNGKYNKKGNPFYYVGVNIIGCLVFSQGAFFTSDPFNFATQEESAKLFKALSDAGKRWNAEKKCVEPLIPFHHSECKPIIDYGPMEFKRWEHHFTPSFEERLIALDVYSNGCNRILTDISKLLSDDLKKSSINPFQKVLVRDSKNEVWSADIFSHTLNGRHYCVGGDFKFIKPYSGNEHLLGTRNV